MNPIQLFELDWMQKYEFESDRRPSIILFFLQKSGKRSISHNARVAKPTRADQSDGMRRRVLTAASLFYFAVQARKLSLSASLAWAGGALKCYPRNSDGGAAIEGLSVSSVFWGRSLGSRVFLAIVLFEKLRLRSP